MVPVTHQKGEGNANTLLKRAKWSTLDVTIDDCAPPGTTALLSPHTRQIGRLSLDHWTEILTLSKVITAPLPLLRTLKIRITEPDDPHRQPNLSLTGYRSSLFVHDVGVRMYAVIS